MNTKSILSRHLNLRFSLNFQVFVFTSVVLFAAPGAKAEAAPEAATEAKAPAAPAEARTSGWNIAGAIVATDFPDLQAAFDALPDLGGTIFLPPGTYTLKKPLNLADSYQRGERKVTKTVVFQGSGRLNTIITADFKKTEEHKMSPLVDATNANRMIWNDVTFSGNVEVLYLSARRDFVGGGGNNFYNVMFRCEGARVGLWLGGSEVNRLYSCEFSVTTPDGVGIAFLPRTEFQIDGRSYKAYSPYVGDNLTGGSNTELRLYGTQIYSFGENSIGLYAAGSVADISIFGGYFANSGFASIYMDGTQGNFGDTIVSGLRVEGETGLHAIYAKGMVRNLIVEGSNISAAGEVIRYVSAPGFYGDTSFAEGWHIRNSSLTIQDQTARYEKKTGGKAMKIPHAERALIRMDRMVNSTVENIWNRGYVVRVELKDKDGKVVGGGEDADYATLIQNKNFESHERLEWFDPKTLIVEQAAEGSTIVVPSMDMVSLPEKGTTRTRVTALGDDKNNVRRTYFGAIGGSDILNLQPTSPSAVRSPKLGDFIVVPARDGDEPVAPRPAFYDGKKWRYITLE